MEMRLSTSEMEVLRKLQRNLAGSSDYACVTCILMLGMGNSPSFVASCLGIDVSTVYRYRSAYLHGGSDELLENRHKGYWGLLDSRQLSALRKELREHICTDAKSVAEWIKSTFGVEYTLQGIVDLLNRIGFTYKKTSEVPCEADASKQAVFAEELSTILSDMPKNTGFYRTKEKFRQAIKNFFDDIGGYKEELESLLTINFRLCNSKTISFWL